MSILNLLRSDGYITVNKFLAKTIGLHEAIILSELISWHLYYDTRNEIDKDGDFFCTVEKMEENTTLSKHQQSIAIKKLISIGLVTCKQKGLPAKRYFKIVEASIEDLINNKKLKNSTTDSTNGFDDQNSKKPRHNQKLKNLTTSGEKIEQLEGQKLDGINALSINHNLQYDLIDRLIDSSPISQFLKTSPENLKTEHIEQISNVCKEIEKLEGYNSETMIEVIKRVLKTYKNDFKACLDTSIRNEIKKQNSSQKVNRPSSSSRGTSKKPKIDIIKNVSNDPPTESELARIRELAKLLDSKNIPEQIIDDNWR